MYKHACQVLIALTLFAVLMVPATQAQSIMLKADIPFDFVVGDKRLPSGEYHVKPINQVNAAKNPQQRVRTSKLQPRGDAALALLMVPIAFNSESGNLVWSR
jgi:hypothetical protein